MRDAATDLARVCLLGLGVFAFLLVVAFIAKPCSPEDGTRYRNMPTGPGTHRALAVPRRGAPSGPHLAENYGKLPLSFEANQGQTDSQVEFLSRGRGYTLFLTGNEAVLALRSQKPGARSQESVAGGPLSAVSSQLSGFRSSPALNLHFPIFNLPSLLPRAPDVALQTIANLQSTIHNTPAPSPQSPAPSVLRLKLVGANPKAKVSGLDELPGKANYFIGNDPKKWRTNVPNYARVKYENVYPGIDLVYYGNQRQLEYDFVVAPGADPNVIALEIEGADRRPAMGSRRGHPLQIDSNGDLVIALGGIDGGEVRFRKPVAYQSPRGGLKPAATSDFNPKSKITNPKSVEGHYVLLADNRIGFKVGAYDRSQPLVIDPTLSYSTYLGGSYQDFADAIAIDSARNVYIVGGTNSRDFPVANAYQPSYGGAVIGLGDLFVTKLNASGMALVYSTYLGGTNGEEADSGIAVDANGNAYVAGRTWSTDFPTTANAFQDTHAADGGFRDAFVTKLNATGDGLVYSTYLGGNAADDGVDLAVDSSGRAYVAGGTSSDDFPATARFPETATAGAFVTRFNADGSALDYSVILGGAWGSAIAVDSSRNAVVTGEARSPEFPVVNPYQPSCQPDEFGVCFDAFVAKLNPAGSALVFSTFLGGNDGAEAGEGIAFDSAGNVYVTGHTDSTDFPTTAEAYDTTCGTDGNCDPQGDLFTEPRADAFVTKFSAAGDTILCSTYLGGGSGDEPNAGRDGGADIAADDSGNAYVIGSTGSRDFPTVDAVQSSCALDGFGQCNSEAFVAMLSAEGSSLVFSTYLGGGLGDEGGAIAVDGSGNIYVAGYTEASDFPTTPGAYQMAFEGMFDAFVAKIAPAPPGPGVMLSPASLDFGLQLVGTTSGSQGVTLTNSGDATLNISGITHTGDFPHDTTCGTTLAAGANCAINVTFSPTATGSRAGTLSIESDAASSPDHVDLSGAGTDFSLSADPTSRTISAGQSTTYTLSVNPVSGFDETVALSCSGAPQRANCQLSASSATPDGTNAAQVTVTVTTTARGTAAPQTRIVPPSIWARYALPLLVFMSLLLFGAAALRRRRANLALAGVLLCVTLWAACGGGQAQAQLGTDAGTYTLTLTGSVGSVSRQTTVTLQVN